MSTSIDNNVGKRHKNGRLRVQKVVIMSIETSEEGDVPKYNWMMRVSLEVKL